MSLTLCWPSWEQTQYIWPSGLSNIFYLGLWPECGLAHKSLPAPPRFLSAFVHRETELSDSPRNSPVWGVKQPRAMQVSAPHHGQLALHWPWAGWQDSCSLPPGHPQWPWWEISLQPHPPASRTPPWPQWTPRCAWSQSMQHCRQPLLGLSGEAAELKIPFWVPAALSAGKHPLGTLAMVARLWWPAETELPLPLLHTGSPRKVIQPQVLHLHYFTCLHKHSCS